jgi:hypothetical protein
METVEHLVHSVTAGTRSSLKTIDRASPGVYLAYPTTEVLKATYYRHQTFVNLSHTKVGIARKSLGSREVEYLRYFNREIVFQPLLQLGSSELRPFETQLLGQMNARFVRSGRAREWFATADRAAIAQLVQELAALSRRAT